MSQQRLANPAQERAINTIARNIAVTAGAGSGKTTVLVGRYLKLLESGLPVSQLVAITFTRKAAAEMSARLREKLEERLKTVTDPIEKTRLTTALQEMNAARISTIHSLCGDIVRANAAACGVDPSFTVLDEVQSKLAFNSARDRVLRALGTSTSPDAPAWDVIRDYGLYSVKSAFSAEMLTAAPPTTETAESLLAAWQAEWEAQMAVGIKSILALPEVQTLLKLTPPSGDKLGENIIVIKNALNQLATAAPVDWDTALLAIKGAKLNVGADKNWQGYPLSKEEAKTCIKAIRTPVEVLLETLGTHPNDDINRQAAHYLVGWYDLLQRVSLEYQATKHRQNALDFNDLERLAALALSDDAVAARYRAQFAHVMVDEFQDTSAAQWDIIRRLAPPDQDGRLFIVGDPKQSIYGFRGSDHTVFTTATAAIRANDVIHGTPNFAAVSLDTSYRTHQALLAVLNTLFDGVMGNTLPPDNPAGYVPFEPLSAGRTDQPEPAPFFHVRLFDAAQNVIHDVKKWDAESIRPQEAADTAAQIVALAAEGVAYGDMAILCRTGTHFHLFESALRARDIPYITTAGRGYFNRQEIDDIINLLTALYNDGDHLALAAALHSPLFNLSDAALYALRKTGTGLWQAVTADAPPADFPTDERAALTFARDTLTALKTHTRRARIVDLLRDILDTTHYLAFLESQSGGAQSRANLEKLVEQAEISGMVSLSQFLAYIEQVKTAEARESDAALDAENAVQLMTIHASKGLEFKVVFLPMTNDHKNNNSPILYHHPTLGIACKLPQKEDKAPHPYLYRRAKTLTEAKEEAEALRLFYVAATRAKDRLILSGDYKLNTDGALNTNGRMRHLLTHQATLMGNHGADVTYQEFKAVDVPRTYHRVNSRPPLPIVDEATQPRTPPLFASITVDVQDRAKHVTTTDLNHLSQSKNAPTLAERHNARKRFRRGVMGQSDSPIRFLTAGIPTSHAPSRIVGEIVHEAIRFGYDLEPDSRLRALLESLVWNQPIGPDLHADAVTRALDLIRRYQRSDLSQAIVSAQTVYREIPFVYQLDSTIIHGQIDLLYRDAHGVWTLVDYKTDYIPRDTAGRYTEADLRAHSRRHLTQLAIYARAVGERLGLSETADGLHVKLHYLSINTTLDLTDDELSDAFTLDLTALVASTLNQSDDAHD